jgi:hypothetical protein
VPFGTLLLVAAASRTIDRSSSKDAAELHGEAESEAEQ